MNRIIKFRAWKDEQMYGDTKSKTWLMNKVDCKIMQFTGLLDKNGKEIYEGDIIEFNESDKIKDGTYMRFFVVWISDRQAGYGWGLANKVNPDVSLGFSHVTSEEVIGNIYENPELL